MTTHLNYGVGNAHQADLMRQAKLGRLASKGTRHESLFRRAVARLHAGAGKSDSPRPTYELAPTNR